MYSTTTNGTKCDDWIEVGAVYKEEIRIKVHGRGWTENNTTAWVDLDREQTAKLMDVLLQRFLEFKT